MIARRFRVQGLVQGVAFRWSTMRAARRLGVAGWVRNVADGSVEGWAEGEAAAVDSLCTWLHDGPSRSRVTGVTLEEAAAEGLEGFEIRS